MARPETRKAGNPGCLASSIPGIEGGAKKFLRGPDLRVVVTGGAGYVGSHVCKALARAGIEPVVLDNLSQGAREAVRWGPLVVGDIADGELVTRTLGEYRAEAVLHFAGSASVAESVADPALYYRNNVAGSLALLDAMRRAGVRHFVFSSTSAVYGNPRRLPIAEDADTAPVSPYGRSKLMVEQMLADEDRAYGLRYMALRYFNAAGADPDGETGDRRRDGTHIISRAMKAAGGEIPHLEIYGEDYDTPDGTCIRDYIHVSDLAAGHLLALDHLVKGGASATLNLGAGRGLSVLEVVAGLERATGRKVPRQRCPRRPGDPVALYADGGAAKRLLGFSTRHSDIDSIVATAWRFYQDQRRR